MALHFTSEEFAERRRTLEAMAARQLDRLLLFKQESMYWLSGYDTFGYCFSSAWCCAPTAIWPC